MSDPSLRPPIPFDPVGAELPEGILLPPTQGGEVVALLVDPGTGLEGWPLRVARALARGWSDAGREVVLVDAHVESPALHQLLDAENEEGLTDAIEFGASPDRVTRALPTEPFSFVSAGTVLASYREFWRSRRWQALLEAYRNDDRIVLLHLPAGDPDVVRIAEAADRSFWIGRPDAPDAAAYPELLVLVPSTHDAAARRMAEVTARGTETRPGLTAAHQDSLGARPERSRSGDAVAHGAGGGPAAGRGVPRSRKGGSRPVGTRRSMPWLLLLLLLVLAGAVIGHWFGFFEIPGLPVRVGPLSFLAPSLPAPPG